MRRTQSYVRPILVCSVLLLLLVVMTGAGWAQEGGDNGGDETGSETTPLDSDDDGLTDEEEVRYNTYPNDKDTDNDGLTDGEEVHTHGTVPTNRDGDSDGLSDGDEVTEHLTDPNDWDSDDDELPDGLEITLGTDPRTPKDEPDSDGDGLGDEDEGKLGTDHEDRDTDNDGLSDFEEVTAGIEYDSPNKREFAGLRTDPENIDSDGDGLSDGDEVLVHKTDPNERDHDGDHLSDGDEVKEHHTNPKAWDSDQDGLSDGEEVLGFDISVAGTNVSVKTNPNVQDTDGDGFIDGKENEEHGTNPEKPDTDDDGLLDNEEIELHQTEPDNPDTDGDGLRDGDEVRGISITIAGTNITVKTNPTNDDTDGDGLTDGSEVQGFHMAFLGVVRTNPAKDDTDDDGLSDGAEINSHKTNPASSDTDGDGLTDRLEVDGPTSPHNPDTDSDGLDDGNELVQRTDPTRPDTDGDGLKDLEEVQGFGVSFDGIEELIKTDPTKTDTDRDGLSDDKEVRGLPVNRAEGYVSVQTHPGKYDTDGDGLSDGDEIDYCQTDPLTQNLSGGNAGDLLDGCNFPVGHPRALPPVLPAAVETPHIPPAPAPSLEADEGDSFGRIKSFLKEVWWFALVLLVAGAVIGGVGIFVFRLLARRKRGNQEDPARARRRQAQSRMPGLQSDLDNLRERASSLRESNLWTEALSPPPEPDRDETAVDDRIRLVNALQEGLRGLELSSGEDRAAIERLAARRRDAGFRIDALQAAARQTPATALPLLRGVVEELEAQRRASRDSSGDYRGQIEDARQLCNREIADTVARRLPRSILDAADGLLDSATTTEEVRASQEVVRGTLAAVYERYFPRHQYQPPDRDR